MGKLRLYLCNIGQHSKNNKTYAPSRILTIFAFSSQFYSLINSFRKVFVTNHGTTNHSPPIKKKVK